WHQPAEEASGAGRSDDQNRISLRNTVIEVDDILVDEPHAAGRHRLPDRPPFRGTVDAVAGVLAVLEQIQRPRAKRVVQPAGLAALPLHQFGLALDHLRGRRPGRPFAAILDIGAAGPAEAVLADADAVADRL